MSDEAKSHSKRPGGALDNLARRTIHLSAANDEGWLPGAVGMRMSQGPGYSLPPDVFRTAARRFGQSDRADALYMLPNQPEGANPLEALFKHFDPAFGYTQDIGNRNQGPGPGMVMFQEGAPRATVQHEAIHQAANPAMQQMDRSTLQGMIPARMTDVLAARNYSPKDFPTEALAWGATEPDQVGVSKEQGNDLVLKYLNEMRKVDPGTANRLAQHLKLASPSTQEADKNLQPPNNVF